MTDHFRIEEFVPEVVFNQYGAQSIWFIDPRLPILAEALREKYGPLTVNNWLWGGGRQNSGFRLPDCETGAYLSDHKRGIALDIVPKNITAEEMLNDVIQNYDLFKPLGLTTVETGTKGWVHISMRNTGLNELLKIKLWHG